MKHDEYYSWILEGVERTANMTQQESKALDNLCKQISPRIQELVNTKISEKLKNLKKEYQDSSFCMVENIRQKLDSLGKNLLKDHNKFSEQINSIKTSIDIIQERQHRLKENEDTFSKVSLTYELS